MNIWFLLTNIDDILDTYGYEALARTTHDDRYTIVPIDRINVELADGCNLRVTWEGREMPLPDAFFPTVSNTDAACLEHLLMAAGCTCMIDMNEFQVARSKIATYQRLAQHGLPVPDTMLFFNRPDKETILKKFDYPFVIKPDNGFGGAGVALIHNEAELDAYLAQTTYGVAYMAQEYIEASRGKDLRVVFLLGKLQQAYLRQAGDANEFRSNVHAGGSISTYEIDSATEELCAQVAKLFDLPLLGIDLLFAHEGFVITEVNAYPGQQGETSNEAASRIVDWFLSL